MALLPAIQRRYHGGIMRKHALMLVTTGKQPLEEVKDILQQCDPDMIDMLQIREKHISAKQYLEWYIACQASLPQTAVMINDRVDAAAGVHAAGVQLAHHSINVQMARQLLPDHMMVGCSVHSIEEAQQAEQHGANYVIFGHIYATDSKLGKQPQGISALSQIVAAVSIPVIAIGGIQPKHVDEVLSTGCSGIAVMSGVLLHSNPRLQLAEYRSMLDSSTYEPRYTLSQRLEDFRNE